ncbi:MAG: hypothetical protein JWQ96_1452 [Segetibacter sp.]|nr:hypothetical protein [Segetibacter sp.]
MNLVKPVVPQQIHFRAPYVTGEAKARTCKVVYTRFY